MRREFAFLSSFVSRQGHRKSPRKLTCFPTGDPQLRQHAILGFLRLVPFSSSRSAENIFPLNLPPFFFQFFQPGIIKIIAANSILPFSKNGFCKSHFVEEQEDLGIVGLYLSCDEIRRKENNETSSPDFLDVSRSFGRHMCKNKR